MPEGIFTVRIDAAKQQQLDAIAQQLERSRNYVVAKAIDDFLALHLWQVQEIQQGVAEAERGEFATEDEVDAVFNHYRPLDA